MYEDFDPFANPERVQISVGRVESMPDIDPAEVLTVTLDGLAERIYIGGMLMIPLLGLTIGDPAGIGPEITLKAARDPRSAVARLVAVGSLQALRAACDVVADPPRLREVAAPAMARFKPGWLDVVTVPSDRPVAFGQLSAEAGQIAFEGVQRAVELAVAGDIDGIVTAPFDKEAIALAGHPYPGHTEILADLTGTREFAHDAHRTQAACGPRDHPRRPSRDARAGDDGARAHDDSARGPSTAGDGHRVAVGRRCGAEPGRR